MRSVDGVVCANASKKDRAKGTDLICLSYCGHSYRADQGGQISKTANELEILRTLGNTDLRTDPNTRKRALIRTQCFQPTNTRAIALNRAKHVCCCADCAERRPCIYCAYRSASCVDVTVEPCGSAQDDPIQRQCCRIKRGVVGHGTAYTADLP